MPHPRDDGRVRPSDAPSPPRSSTWRLELGVALLGLLAGLTAATVFLA